jgi:hypothetical protein
MLTLFRGPFQAGFALFLLSLPAPAQTFSLRPASAGPSEPFTIDLSFKPGDKAVSTLQWETRVPSSHLAFQQESAAIGAAARAAGKAVSCSVKSTTRETQTSVCILYGGQNPIPDGVVAVLHLKALPKARGTVRIRVEQGLAVSKELQRFPVEPVETTVRIRPK